MTCPEVEVGLGTPRPSVRLQGASPALRMVEPKSGEDWTSRMNTYSRSRVRELRTQDQVYLNPHPRELMLRNHA